MMPEPQVAGTIETIAATGLSAGTTYYFAAKAGDEVLQFSELSNEAAATTVIPNLTWFKKRVYWASWSDYSNRLLSIDYTLTNSGSGIATGSAIHASMCNPNTVFTVTQLPLVIGDINPLQSRNVMLKYYVPINVGSFTTGTYANCSDDAGRSYWFPGTLP